MFSRILHIGLPLIFGLVLGASSRAAPIDWPELSTSEIATGATFPVSVAHSPDGSGRLFVAEQTGRILVTTSNGFAAAPFLDISDRVSFEFGTEDGLLGLAFAPNYAMSGKFYVYYTRTGDLASVISRFSVSSNSNQADVASEENLLVIPEVTERTLNGGMLVFGLDGYLYLTTGDNGFNLFVASLAQNPSSLWGKMLRIDVASLSSGYAIPPSNPFVGWSGYAPEIWAMGYRNPWRFSFDRANGDLYVSDVGQFLAEEIDYEPSPSLGGRNYGWRAREGAHGFFDDLVQPGSPTINPILEVRHGLVFEPTAITGGYVYRGPDRPRMNGMYFYSDFYTGLIKGLIRSNGIWVTAPVGQTTFLLSAFGEDQAGNLYVTDYISGGLYRLDDSGKAHAPEFSPAGPTSPLETITLTTRTPGAIVYYTTNGADPTLLDPSIPAGGTVTIATGATLKARASRSGLQQSEITSSTYVLQAAKPHFSPSLGPVTNNAPVMIASATPAAQIRFTLDGTDPSSDSTPYSAPVAFPTNQTLKARAFRDGFGDSPVATFHSAPLKFQNSLRIELRDTYDLTWSSMTGQIYRVQYSPDFSYWLDISSNLVATGSTTSFTNFFILPNPRRGFFRVATE